MRDIEGMREPVMVEKKLWERYRYQRLAPLVRGGIGKQLFDAPSEKAILRLAHEPHCSVPCQGGHHEEKKSVAIHHSAITIQRSDLREPQEVCSN
jgi:hypothetical protein